MERISEGEKMGVEDIISIKRLFFSFEDRVVFKDLSLSVKRGEFLFITGPSGSGKTTLLKILHGELPVKTGIIRIAGFDVRRLGKKRLYKLRQRVSMVYQDFMILEDYSVEKNVSLPLKVLGINSKELKKRVEIVLRSLKIKNLKEEVCSRLSGGEKQRVAIARAIVVNPQLLLADEPTGNLDAELSMRLIRILGQFNKHGTTIVFATHNPSLREWIPQARLLTIKGGRIEEE